MLRVVASTFVLLALAASSACPQEAPDSADPVRKKVTVLLKGVTLQELADEITLQTGITYKISRTLADERLTVMVKDKPLELLHRLIADLYKVHVSRDDSATGDIRFEIWADAKRRELDSNLTKNAWSDIAASFLKDARNGESPIKSFQYADPLLQIVAEFDQQEMYRIVDGKSAYIPYEMLTKPQKDRLFRAYELLEGGLAKSQQGDEEEGFFPVRRDDVSAEDIERFGLRLSVVMDSYGGRCFLMPRLVEKFSSSRMALCDVSLRDSAYLPVRGCPYTRNEEEEVAAITLPAPDAPIDIPANATWEDALEAVHKATSLTIVSDYYLPSGGYHVQKDKMPARFEPDKEALPDFLDNACKASEHLWWDVDGACLFRTQLWYVRRLYEAPKDQLDKWQKTLETKGGLSRADIDQLAMLTARQIEGLAALCGQGAGWGADDFYEALSFYKGLTSTQKDAVLKNGVPSDVLSPEKQAVLRQMVRNRTYSAWYKLVNNPRLIVIQGGESSFYYPSHGGAPSMKTGKAHELAFWVKLGDPGDRNVQAGCICIPYAMDEKPAKKAKQE